MRIPTSVIVMSLLTAAPFGLAIRDTLNRKPASELSELYGELESGDFSAREARRDHEALAEYEREMALEAEQRELRRRDNLKRLDALFGSTKASPGRYFDGIALGAPITEAVEDKIAASQDDDFAMAMVDGTDTIDAITAVVYDDDDDESSGGACGALRDKLTAAWGPAVDGTWLDPATHQRATLIDDPCKLTFARFTEPADWVAALPVDLIGQSTAKVAATLPDADVYDDAIEWTRLGTGYSDQKTAFYAHVDARKGKVTGIRVSGNTDFDSLIQIRDALAAKLKAPPTRDEDTGAWVWTKKPGFMLIQDARGNQFTLVIGKDPDQ